MEDQERIEDGMKYTFEELYEAIFNDEQRIKLSLDNLLDEIYKIKEDNGEEDIDS